MSMNVYAMGLRDVHDADAIQKLMRPQVLAKGRVQVNRGARYGRVYLMIRRVRRTARYDLVVEVKAHDLEQAHERAGTVLRPSIRDDHAWEYRGAYGGFTLAL